MRFVWISACKDFRRLRRDPFTLATWLGIPLILAVLMHVVFGGAQTSPQGRVLIADEDHSFVSGMLTGAFGYGPLRKVLLVEKVGRDEGKRRIDRGDGSAFLIIPAGLESASLRHQPFRLQLFLNPAQRIAPKIIEEALSIAVNGNFTVTQLVQLETSVVRERQTKSFATVFFPASMFMALLLVANALAGEIWNEHALGTLRRLTMTPAPLAAFLAGRLIFVAMIFSGIALVGMAAMRWLAPIPIFDLPEAALWLVLSGTAYFLILLLLSLYASGQRSANVLGNMVIFPLALVGGCFLPFEIMPDWMVAIGRLTPNGWAIGEFRAILSGTASARNLAVAVAAVAVVDMLIFPLVLRRMRRSLLV